MPAQGRAQPRHAPASRSRAAAKAKEIALGEDSDSTAGADSPGPEDVDVRPSGSRRHGGSMHGDARGSRDDPPGRLPDAPVAHAGQGSPRDVVAPEDDEVHDVPFDAMVAAFRPREGSASTSSGVRRPPMPSEAAALQPPAAAAAAPLPEAVPGAGEQVRIRRGDRATPWGPFSLASVWSKGKQIGWGATCGRHSNPDDADHPSTQCKKMITYGEEGISDDVCILKWKRWLHFGYWMTAEELGDRPRTKHVSIGARTLEEGDVAIFDAWAASLPS